MSFEDSKNMPPFVRAGINEQIDEVIPDRCRDCGVQCELGDQLMRSLVIKRMMDFMADSLVGENGEVIDEFISSVMPAEYANDAKKSVREDTAERLDKIDKAIDTVTQESILNSSSCSGPLKMRATKDGTSYTVSVCTSSNQYEEDGTGHLTTHVSTRPVDK